MTDTGAITGNAASRPSRRAMLQNPATLGMYAFVALMAVLVVIGAFTTQGFLTTGNFRRSLPPPPSSASSRSGRR